MAGEQKVNSKSTRLEFSLSCQQFELKSATVMLTKSDSDVILSLQLLSKTLTCTLHLSLQELIDHLCINPILRIGLIHE